MSETHTHESHETEENLQETWDTRYAEHDRIWSGNPNALLIREASDLEPGRALELGCGEGADAIWLAERGWHVTGVDISQIALDRAAEHASDATVADRVDFQRHVLGETFPAGEFDLITAFFFHNFGEFRREEILRTAAAAIAPGGTLLIVGHRPMTDEERAASTAEGHNHPGARRATPAEALASLELVDGEWEVLRAEDFDSPRIGPDGEPITRADNVLKVRRLP